MAAPVLLVISIVSALLLASGASATGGNYVVHGGTLTEQAQVRAALEASSFTWNIVPTEVTIHIVRGISASHSTPGQIWLDADLLDSGKFSWGVVQMEYGHQVQFALIKKSMQAQLTAQLGATQWCYEDRLLPTGDNACERFAATLAWAYWPKPENSLKPAGPHGWSASMDARTFRALLARLIGARNLIDAPRVGASHNTEVAARSRP
jgi:hypothetical protein